MDAFSHFHCILLLLLISSATRVCANFYDDVDVMWGAGNVSIFNEGSLIESKQEFLYGSFSMVMKLVKGESVGDFYVSESDLF
ncbi:hypothetical protein SUGI_1018700 [Cryptomeria japonica]|nr:hypothetical protein SUGI_1018700 [Cryptomeria japonica]